VQNLGSKVELLEYTSPPGVKDDRNQKCPKRNSKDWKGEKWRIRSMTHAGSGGKKEVAHKKKQGASDKYAPVKQYAITGKKPPFERGHSNRRKEEEKRRKGGELDSGFSGGLCNGKS